jgi:FKBP-type peptidyl-prolyl cis-trans isomerase
VCHAHSTNLQTVYLHAYSLGYGEDDDKEGTFITMPVGGGKLISAVDEAIVGMHVGGKRRVLVRPDRDQGWKKSDPNCASLFDVGMASGIPGATIAKVSYSVAV